MQLKHEKELQRQHRTAQLPWWLFKHRRWHSRTGITRLAEPTISAPAQTSPSFSSATGKSNSLPTTVQKAPRCETGLMLHWQRRKILLCLIWIGTCPVNAFRAGLRGWDPAEMKAHRFKIATAIKSGRTHHFFEDSEEPPANAARHFRHIDVF